VNSIGTSGACNEGGQDRLEPVNGSFFLVVDYRSMIKVPIDVRYPNYALLYHADWL
jgi:hypothetical protein